MKDALVKWWQRTFFEPTPPLTMALFRIFFGIILLAEAFLVAPDLLTWYGQDAIISLRTAQAFLVGPQISLLTSLFTTDGAITAFFFVFVLASITLTLGLFTRTSAAIVYICLVSFHHRNPFITNSADVLTVLLAFYLIFAPAGYALSLDNVYKRRRGIAPPSAVAPWVQRLMQFQIALLYCQTFWVKLEAPEWFDGTMLYYCLKNPALIRFPMPLFSDNLILCQLGSWLSLGIELAMWTLVWWKPARYLVLASAVLLHLAIEVTMNIPVFEWLMFSCLLLFVRSEDVKTRY